MSFLLFIISQLLLLLLSLKEKQNNPKNKKSSFLFDFIQKRVWRDFLLFLKNFISQLKFHLNVVAISTRSIASIEDPNNQKKNVVLVFCFRST
jgi:hypothetical protein